MLLKRKQFQKGFSIIGVVVAIGLAGFLSLILLTLVDTMTKISAKSKFDNDIAADLSVLKFAFADPILCAANLSGQVVVGVYTELTPNRLDFKFLENKGDPVLSANSILPVETLVDKAAIRQIDPTSGIATLRLDFKSKNTLIGSNEVSRNIILSVNLDSSTNEILSCSSQANTVVNTGGSGFFKVGPGRNEGSDIEEWPLAITCDLRGARHVLHLNQYPEMAARGRTVAYGVPGPHHTTSNVAVRFDAKTGDYLAGVFISCSRRNITTQELL